MLLVYGEGGQRINRMRDDMEVDKFIAAAKISFEGWILLGIAATVAMVITLAVRIGINNDDFVERCEAAGGKAVVTSDWGSKTSPRFCVDPKILIDIDGTRMRRGR